MPAGIGAWLEPTYEAKLPSGGVVKVYEKLINFVNVGIGADSAYFGSINPMGAREIRLLCFADANPGAAVTPNVRFKYGSGRTQWFLNASLSDFGLVMQTAFATNWAINKSTDQVGGPVIITIGHSSTGGLTVPIPYSVMIDEMQFGVHGGAGAANYRVDVATVYW